jgi:hypothetical protein
VVVTLVALGALHLKNVHNPLILIFPFVTLNILELQVVHVTLLIKLVQLVLLILMDVVGVVMEVKQEEVVLMDLLEDQHLDLVEIGDMDLVLLKLVLLLVCVETVFVELVFAHEDLEVTLAMKLKVAMV